MFYGYYKCIITVLIFIVPEIKVVTIIQQFYFASIPTSPLLNWFVIKRRYSGGCGLSGSNVQIVQIEEMLILFLFFYFRKKVKLPSLQQGLQLIF